MTDETHRFFKCDGATYTALATAVDQSRGYPRGVGTRAVTLRGLPPFDELEIANDDSGRGLIAIDNWRFTPADDELIAPAIGAGLIEELTLEQYQTLRPEETGLLFP
mgnify:CR=1 FL=1